MRLGVGVLRALYASPRFKGRDRMIGALSDGFVQQPAALQHDDLRMYLERASTRSSRSCCMARASPRRSR
jgi:hypothetical protein